MPSPWNPHTAKGTFGSQGYMNLMQRAQEESWTALCIIHVLGWPLSELKDLPEWCLWSVQEDCCRSAVLSYFSREVFLFQWITKMVPFASGSSNGTLEGTALGFLWHVFCLSANCALYERRQTSYIQVIFCLRSDPDFSDVFMCSLHFMEEQKSGSWALQQGKSLPLCLWLEGLELWWWLQTKSRGLWIKQSMSHFAKGKKDHSFLCLGLVGWLEAQIVLMNNLHGHWLFSKVKLFRIGETKGPASHLPDCQHYGHHFLSCFESCIKVYSQELIELSHRWHFSSQSQPAPIGFSVSEKTWNVSKIGWERKNL